MKVVAETGPATNRDERPLLPISVGGPELFRTFGTTLIRGREFLPSEVVEGAPRPNASCGRTKAPSVSDYDRPRTRVQTAG
jgi:hypothetical protein